MRVWIISWEMNSKLFYKDYEYDEEYAMIRVDAIVHIPTRALCPQSCLRTRPAYTPLVTVRLSVMHYTSMRISNLI